VTRESSGEQHDSANAVADLERRLSRALYRFDCPSPQQLGDYHLGLVSPEDRLSIAQHVLDCVECAAELRMLRTYLVDEPRWSVGRATQVRRLLASLVDPLAWRPEPSLAGLRGAEGAPAAIYRAEDLSVSLMRGPGERELSGLVARDVLGPEDLAGAEVHLLAADGTRQVAPIGSAGDFAFAEVPLGKLDLELRLPDRVVIVPGVQFDRL
jgi:hypothetical protein